ncbi:MAG: hypothetical protein V4449_04030 [Patescibacteria group bacterium]
MTTKAPEKAYDMFAWRKPRTSRPKTPLTADTWKNPPGPSDEVLRAIEPTDKLA